MQIHFSRLIYALLLVFGGLSLAAQVTINEYSAANWKQYYDNHNDHEDWIELYNAGNTAANIGNFWLSDNPDNLQKFQFPAGTTIPSGGFLVVWCSRRGTVEGSNFHANFRLTQTKNNPEVLTLSNAQGNIVDQIEIKKTATHQSRCRKTNGAADWRICTTPTLGTSNNGSTQFKNFADRPTMDQSAGFYAGLVTVNISSTVTGGTIRYTTDGTEPRATSPVYSSPLVLTETTVVKARVFSTDPEVLPSFVRFNTYFIDEDYSLPVISIAADSLQELANGDKTIRPIGSIEYFEADKTRQAASYGELNSHGQDSWVNDQRSLDWISRDEMGYSKAVEYPLFTYSQRDEYQRFILRASGDDNYPATDEPHHDGSCHMRDDYAQTLAKVGGMSLDVRASERAIVFLNGDYWGIYSIREKPDDHDYTDYYYNQDKFNVQVLNTWYDTWAEYGGEAAHEDWKSLRKWILSSDMSQAANYQAAADSIDMLSMIDYFLLNLNVVATDWLNYNTGWWRGLNPEGGHKKWGYNLWDLDATFDYYINYSFVPNTQYDATPCDLVEMSAELDNFFVPEDSCFIFPPDTFCIRVDGKHHQIFLKLIEENKQFRQLYYSRQADLMNTVFSCENMLSVFDSMVAVIAPEMPRQIQRWGGTMEEWTQNIQQMRTYITNRCGYFPEGMTECYEELTGPQPVTIIVEPAGAGKVQFNTITHQNFPWTGNYFGGMDQLIKATPTGVLNFHHWESRSGNTIAAPFSASTTYAITQPDTLVAVFSNSVSTTDLNGVAQVNVFPTLVNNNEVTLNYHLPNEQEMHLRLISSLGQSVSEWHFSAEKEKNTRLDLANLHLAGGVYWLEGQAGPYRFSKKLVVAER
jgi:hypothetical protein